MALPEVTLQDHHGIDSLRVRGKVFASFPDDDHIRVMVGETEIHAVVAEYPGVCAPFYWGTRLACVVVDVAHAPSDLLRELLVEAWLRQAPATLRRHLTPKID